ncbi:DUF3124 domain-containing protein [Geobacter pickeringii]|uniref:DUF3124 domain-containing protein n=1 Tax=Geobacter pickeringii TaxID=345632 RepID=A0A0B5BE06_9BACT|nr:DUF3124 domain-containing protein [Geobacter pickeringii]AJE02306.1 hypothetical protein GPICK_01985 [Geobacter pickeringii]
MGITSFGRLLVAAGILTFLCTATVGAEPRLSRGQTLYVPVYSHVYTGDRALPFNLAATLSIRNTDPVGVITVTAVDYHDSNGRLVKRSLAAPHPLAPQGSTNFFLKEQDTAGGFGAHYIVRWEAPKEVSEPVVEAIMIGARSGQGISFVSPGREIRPAPGR